MKARKYPTIAFLAACLLTTTGCMFDLGPADLGRVRQAARSNNGINIQGLTSNGLLGNGIDWQGLANNSLGANGIGWQGLASNSLGTNGTGWQGLADNSLGTNGVHIQGLADNSLGANGIHFQGMHIQGLANNGMYWQGLDDEAVEENWLGKALEDPSARQLFQYTVGCALRSDQEVVVEIAGKPVTFPGLIGLAPEWGEPGGSCDLTCQGWVSACLISRVNGRGQHVLISMRGNHPALALEPGEAESHTIPDGVYYGQVFGDKPTFYACLPEKTTTLDRVCGGQDTDDCFVEVMGLCRDVCDERGCLDTEGNVHEQVIHVFLAGDTGRIVCDPEIES